MYKIESIYCLLFYLAQIAYSQRRIIDGITVHSNKGYVAYLVKAQSSKEKYNSWLCGATIVHPYFLVTSSACVEDVEHIYAIAGLSEYVRTEDVKSHPCTKKTKKKVVMTCVPTSYELDERVDTWSKVDIAVAKVDAPFDFKTKASGCSYAPAAIDINYDAKYQEPGTETQVYGWGHTKQWRLIGNNTDLNQKTLRYAPLLIQPKEMCIYAYRAYNLTNIIRKYMLCVNSSANIDERGHIIKKVDPTDGCITEYERQRGVQGKFCPNNSMTTTTTSKTTKELFVDFTRTGHNPEEDSSDYRRNGICQNDHGGPLVTFIGSREYLIGVASVFRVNKRSKCVGPFLFTSTKANGAFLDCVISQISNKSALRSHCNKHPGLRGFGVKTRRISWTNFRENSNVNGSFKEPSLSRKKQPGKPNSNKNRILNRTVTKISKAKNNHNITNKPFHTLRVEKNHRHTNNSSRYLNINETIHDS